MPKKRSRFFIVRRVANVTLSTLAIAYILLLYFPQPLFAYSTRYESFQVYSRQPIQPELIAVLDSAEERLKTSPIYDASATRHVYLTDSHGMYALLSHTAYKAFANSVPFIKNVFINKSDVATDRVYVNREHNNSRSLSGVIAHEITHLLIQKQFGTVNSIFLPTWKTEGYCEYVARDSTITLEEGIRRWRENPSDEPSYRYIKYHLMVKHLIENEGMSVEDLFKQSLDESAIAERTFAGLNGS